MKQTNFNLILNLRNLRFVYLKQGNFQLLGLKNLKQIKLLNLKCN